MEERYTTESFKDYWTLQKKYQSWLRVEFEVYMAHICCGTFKDPNLDWIQENIISNYMEMGPETIKDILEIEKETKHDVVAFIQWLEAVTGGRTRLFHYGMTSSDLVDTSMALRLSRALGIINRKLFGLCNELSRRAQLGINQVMMGRSHGMHAQPTTVSNFFAGHLSEFIRAYDGIEMAQESIRHGKISGPVGSYLNIHPKVEEFALRTLGLKVEPVSTQVIPRDRYLEVVFSIARCAAAIERLATNIRHLHRTEVGEISESFGNLQKGSSSMPHKRNPITCENLCGLSRYIRGCVGPSFEDVALWHERDISHSSVERIIIPAVTAYIDYMLETTTNLVQGLSISSDVMKQRVDDNPSWRSEHAMLRIIDCGESRSAAHTYIEKHWSGEKGAPSYSNIFEHAKIILARVLALKKTV